MTPADEPHETGASPVAPRTGFSTARLEAFSDGVLAIAITLLVLDLQVPEPDTLHGETLLHALGRQWPGYFAYLVSFLVIGIIWINHHAMCALARRVDRRTLFANLFLLLTVSVIPYPTRLLATYLTAGHDDASTAAALYAATMVSMGIAFSLLFLSFTRDARALHTPVPPEARRAALRRFGIGGVAYLATVGLAYLSPVAMLATHALIAVYYCYDQLAPARRTS
ncbi:putative membrane protein [Streptomyces sp. 1114.5]|uniref:TMEM175 family protein n=1 Tax=Streptomyces sp. 1114.5 TaxID=1938830 RepID=UPI000EAC5EEA|nr:TMEM175 family protein [Streptomyces sp. 1114.5]RKT09467.1 putative membrane protein [Streptomyces sp. 1114.5]